MDEAGRLIHELQQKLTQLDRKVWLYRHDMSAEFRKYADWLLSSVPEEVSETVNSAIQQSLGSYRSLDMSSLEQDRSSAEGVQQEAETDRGRAMIDKATQEAVTLEKATDGADSPAEQPSTSRERADSFQGIFIPSYLPLLGDDNHHERKSSTGSAISPTSERKPLDITTPTKPTPDNTTLSSSFPPSSSLPKLPTPRRRNTEDPWSISSPHHDVPRRSALRRTSSSTKPHSPRQVRFEFEGTTVLPTSSPKIEPLEPSGPVRSPIILGMGGIDEIPESTLSLLGDDETEEDPPPRRISSSSALRMLSRRPQEDDGTTWSEVIAPSDGSPSVPKDQVPLDEDSDDEELNMPMSVTASFKKANGHKKGDSLDLARARTNRPDEDSSLSTDRNDSTTNGVKTTEKIDVVEEGSEDMIPLQHVAANTNIPQEVPAPKTPPAKMKGKNKSMFMTADGTDLNDVECTEADPALEEEDEDDLFAFEENIDRRSSKPLEDWDDDDEDEDDEADEEPLTFSKLSTSPFRPIPQPSTSVDTNKQSGIGSLRSSYHPFMTPIVNPAIHEQAASLGNINTFVGSVKDGMEEQMLQSFRGGASLTGGVPRSLSERMAFEEAMEARAASRRK
jgi:hypothetical protein